MSALRKLAFGMAMAGAMAAPALAEGYGENTVVMYAPGMMKEVKVDAKTADWMAQHGKAVDGPVMVMMKGGKTWIVENAKMPSGKMLWDYLADPSYKGGA